MLRAGLQLAGKKEVERRGVDGTRDERRGVWKDDIDRTCNWKLEFGRRGMMM